VVSLLPKALGRQSGGIDVAQIYEPKNPRTRSKIFGEVPQRVADNRLTVHPTVKPPEKPKGKSTLNRGVYDG